MKDIKVRKGELIAKMEGNRYTHRTDFEEAMDGYRVAVIKRLDEMMEQARKGKQVDQYVNLIMPEDHTDDYDRVIAMLSMDTEDTVLLSEGDFAKYVLDAWAWKEQFTATNAYYGAVR